MANEIAQLKAELNDLNVKCQLARDNEVRFALQRGRLEAERMQLLVRMVEAVAPVTSVAAPAVARPGAYNITMSPRLTCPKAQEPIPVTLRTEAPSVRQAARKTPRGRRSSKPAGIPTTEEMTLAVLQGAGWLRPNQITQAIRDRYWPDAPRNSAPPVVWRMAEKGQLEKSTTGEGYRLPVHHVVAEPSEQTRKSNGQFGA